MKLYRSFPGMKSIAMIFCSLLTCYSSCKKGDSGTNWRIPMIETETTNNSTTTYSYDNIGRLVKIENGDWIKTEISYLQDSIFFKTTELATGVVQKSAGKLNAQGLLIPQDGTGYKFDRCQRQTDRRAVSPSRQS